MYYGGKGRFTLAHCNRLSSFEGIERGRALERTDFGMALARALGIPIVTRPLGWMDKDLLSLGHWTGEYLYLPNDRQTELFHEIGHWVEGRQRGVLKLPDYGLDPREDSPRLEITAEEVAKMIEWLLLVASDVAMDRILDMLESFNENEKTRSLRE